MSFKILMAGVTHHGRIRTNNEDNLYMGGKYLALGIQDLSEILYVEKSSRPWTAAGVFDGMGGENAGETAAFTGAQTFASCMASWEAQSMRPEDFLEHTCQAMNRAVVSHAGRFRLGQTGTTAAVLYFRDERAGVCNVGDSSVFLLRENKMRCLTKAHTNAAFLKQQGIEGRTPALTQFIGIPEDEMTLCPHVGSGRLRHNDRFLLCSDGLTDMVREEDIARWLYTSPTPKAAAAVLTDQALEKGGRDNITVIVCHVVYEPAGK